MIKSDVVYSVKRLSGREVVFDCSCWSISECLMKQKQTESWTDRIKSFSISTFTECRRIFFLSLETRVKFGHWTLKWSGKQSLAYSYHRDESRVGEWRRKIPPFRSRGCIVWLLRQIFITKHVWKIFPPSDGQWIPLPYSLWIELFRRLSSASFSPSVSFSITSAARDGFFFLLPFGGWNLTIQIERSTMFSGPKTIQQRKSSCQCSIREYVTKRSNTFSRPGMAFVTSFPYFSSFLYVASLRSVFSSVRSSPRMAITCFSL